jgi:hypothetical protein
MIKNTGEYFISEIISRRYEKSENKYFECVLVFFISKYILSSLLVLQHR